MTVAGVDAIEDKLWLAMRQCATHTAGPLAAVAAFGQARATGTITDEEIDAMLDRLERRYREQSGDVLGERLTTVHHFLSALR